MKTGTRPYFMARTTKHEQADIVRINGDLAWDTVAGLHEKLSALDSPEVTPLVLDLERVEFIDSRGMTFLLKSRYSYGNRRVALASVPPNIRKVLERTFILDRFIILDTPEDLETLNKYIVFA